MRNVAFIDERPGFSRRSLQSNRPSARHNPTRVEISRLRQRVGKIWRAVGGFLRALDKRITENLDQRARLLIDPRAGEPAQRRRTKNR
jgi:hypothetical protein